MRVRLAAGSVIVLLDAGACARENPLFGIEPDATTTAEDDTEGRGGGGRGPNDGSGGQAGQSEETGVAGTTGLAETGGGTAGDSDPGGSSSTDTDGSIPGVSSTGEGAESGGIEAPSILFVNFDGANLTAGPDDATVDQSMIAGAIAQPLSAYPGTPVQRATIIAGLEEIWAPFNVEVVAKRPASGDYAMVVVSGSPPPTMGQLGVSTLDCNDANAASVGIIFAPDAILTEAALAVGIAGTAGMGYGLERVAAPDVMNQAAVPGASFTDDCLELTTAMPTCPHPRCPAGLQNAFAHLSALFPKP